jgi:hypothetical protein
VNRDEMKADCISSRFTVHGLRLSNLQLAALDDRLVVECDGRAGEEDDILVGRLVVAAGPLVVADADGDGAGGNPVAELARRRELDVRVDAEVNEGEYVAPLARGIIVGLELVEAGKSNLLPVYLRRKVCERIAVGLAEARCFYAKTGGKSRERMKAEG